MEEAGEKHCQAWHLAPPSDHKRRRGNKPAYDGPSKVNFTIKLSEGTEPEDVHFWAGSYRKLPRGRTEARLQSTVVPFTLSEEAAAEAKEAAWALHRLLYVFAADHGDPATDRHRLFRQLRTIQPVLEKGLGGEGCGHVHPAAPAPDGCVRLWGWDGGWHGRPATETLVHQTLSFFPPELHSLSSVLFRASLINVVEAKGSARLEGHEDTGCWCARPRPDGKAMLEMALASCYVSANIAIHERKTGKTAPASTDPLSLPAPEAPPGKPRAKRGPQGAATESPLPADGLSKAQRKRRAKKAQRDAARPPPKDPGHSDLRRPEPEAKTTVEEEPETCSEGEASTEEDEPVHKATEEPPGDESSDGASETAAEAREALEAASEAELRSLLGLYSPSAVAERRERWALPEEWLDAPEDPGLVAWRGLSTKLGDVVRGLKAAKRRERWALPEEWLDAPEDPGLVGWRGLRVELGEVAQGLQTERGAW